MGWSGAAISAEPERPPVLAVAAPSAMLVAEAIFLAIDRKVWRYNLGAKTYRLIDLGVMLALLVGGLALPLFFEKDRAGDGSSTWSSRWRALEEPSRSWCCGN